MSILQKILSSKVRAEIFRLLFTTRDAELHVRELARRSKLNESSLRQELAKLKGLDLVVSRRDGNRVYYRANQDHPVFSDIRGLVLKTTGLIEVIRKALKSADITVAFVFGSVAAGSEAAHSDVDLMVIGNIGLRKLSSCLSEVSSQVAREINSHVMMEAEYRNRLKSKDHFVTRVLSGPKLYVRGNANDIEAMAN